MNCVVHKTHLRICKTLCCCFVLTHYNTIIDIHTANVIEIRLRKSGSYFEPVINANLGRVAPSPKTRSAICGYPKVAFNDMLGEQLHHFNPVNHQLKICRQQGREGWSFDKLKLLHFLLFVIAPFLLAGFEEAEC